MAALNAAETLKAEWLVLLQIILIAANEIEFRQNRVYAGNESYRSERWLK